MSANDLTIETAGSGIETRVLSEDGVQVLDLIEKITITIMPDGFNAVLFEMADGTRRSGAMKYAPGDPVRIHVAMSEAS